MEMLTRAVNEVEGLGWSVVNVDATVLVEDIRLAGHRDRMEANISKHFSNDAPVNVKFKTADGFGPVGNRDVVDSQVVVLVKQTE